MSTLKVLMVDLKSDLPSPLHRLGLLASYAQTEPEVAKNVGFSLATRLEQ